MVSDTGESLELEANDKYSCKILRDATPKSLVILDGAYPASFRSSLLTLVI